MVVCKCHFVLCFERQQPFFDKPIIRVGRKEELRMVILVKLRRLEIQLEPSLKLKISFAKKRKK